jgi:hypothetical protein
MEEVQHLTCLEGSSCEVMMIFLVPFEFIRKNSCRLGLNSDEALGPFECS